MNSCNISSFLQVPPNAIKDSCKSYGCFPNDVKYTCRGGSHWDSKNVRCAISSRSCTKEEEKWYCHTGRFTRCYFDKSVALGPICACKPNIGGFQCYNDLNVCLTSQDENIPPGDFACGVHLGNQCHPSTFDRFGKIHIIICTINEIRIVAFEQIKRKVVS